MAEDTGTGTGGTTTTTETGVNNEVIDNLTQKPDPATLPDSLKTIKVDGKDIEVKDLEHLKALAQKGVAFEGRYNDVSRELAEVKKKAAALDDLKTFKESGDVEAYKRGLKAVGYTDEQIDSEIQQMRGGSTEENPELAELRRQLAKKDDELSQIRDMVKDRESHTVRGLIRESILGNDYIKKVLEARDEDGSAAVVDFLVENATRAAQQYVKEHPYMPSSDRDVAAHAAKAAIEQARKLGLSAPTPLGRGGGTGGPGEVEIKPPQMPTGDKATPDAVQKFISQHLTNALQDRQNRFGGGH